MPRNGRCFSIHLEDCTMTKKTSAEATVRNIRCKTPGKGKLGIHWACPLMNSPFFMVHFQSRGIGRESASQSWMPIFVMGSDTEQEAEAPLLMASAGRVGMPGSSTSVGREGHIHQKMESYN